MIAAIYARKSTEQRGTDDEAKSVPRQIDNARGFAAARGWTVLDAHVYSDDGISGAETRKLVNRQRLLDLIASGRAPFQILILRDASRFSRRDGDEAFAELKRIAQAGVEIWFYDGAKRFTFGTFADNIIGFVTAEMHADYRRQIARLTHEGHVRKAKAGHVTGGHCFGYNNVPVDGHVEHRINGAEAAVIRQIFDFAASGWGYTRIAKHLNETGAPAPRPARARVNGAMQQAPAGWNPSTVRTVLLRPRYRGQIVWNQTTKRNAAGDVVTSKRPKSDWIKVDRPELAIVSDAQWQAVQWRLTRVKQGLAETHPTFRRRRDIDSKYLLSGFARCAVCGGTLAALSRNGGKSRLYGCLAHSKRGAKVCPNALAVPISRVEAQVVNELRFTLRPAVVRALLDKVFALLEPQTVAVNVAALQKDLRALDKKIAHLMAAVESGQAVAPLVARLAERQAERETLLASIAAAEAVAQVRIDRQRVQRELLAEVARWREDLATDGRGALRQLLDGPLQFKPTDKGYEFDGELRTGERIAGLIDCPPFMARPAGNHKGWNLRFSGIAA